MGKVNENRTPLV